MKRPPITTLCSRTPLSLSPLDEPFVETEPLAVFVPLDETDDDEDETVATLARFATELHEAEEASEELASYGMYVTAPSDDNCRRALTVA